MAYLTADELLDTEDGFTEWNEDAAAGSTEETLEQALAEERLAELESELEQDEHPVNYDAELETEEEEAAPVSDKRLKREIRAESIRRLEEAARTEKDFWTVVEEWNKLDRNRERRERDHENLRGDVPLEYQVVPEPSSQRESQPLLSYIQSRREKGVSSEERSAQDYRYPSSAKCPAGS